MKRTERVGAMIHILSQNPNQAFSLSYFCKLFDCAKSSVSEDAALARKALESAGMGSIETMTGSKGGLKYVPRLWQAEAKEILDRLCEKLNDKSRILGNGFLYTSDVMFDPRLTKGAARIFASRFSRAGGDYVVTVETKGIPVALMTAELLNLPLVVLRRESKISEGSTVSINYFSGSTERIQRMSIAKRAVRAGSRAIIIDDFMRAGGSVKGLVDMMKEFDVEVAGIGVVIASQYPEKKKVQDYFPLLFLGEVDEEAQTIQLSRNDAIFSWGLEDVLQREPEEDTCR